MVDKETLSANGESSADCMTDKLETASIAEPLQNRQHAQNP